MYLYNKDIKDYCKINISLSFDCIIKFCKKEKKINMRY